MQKIVIQSSLEMGSIDQLGSEDFALEELRGDTPISPALQVIHPLDRLEIHSDNAKLARAGRKRPLPPDLILLNCYLPLCGPAPMMEKVIVPELEDIKRIIQRWKPFNWGESTIDHLNDLYPRMLRIPVTARAVGLGEEYFVVVPLSTVKEDIQQIVEDKMQIRNRNYVQSTELVK